MAGVRGWLAAALRIGGAPQLGGEGGGDAHLSRQQQEAVARGAQVVEAFGGVVLADGVGVGKTREALALGRAVRRGQGAGRMLLVVPSRLQGAWRRVAGEMGLVEGRHFEVVTHHRMSHGRVGGGWAVVVVDEAHRFRRVSTRRGEALMRLSAEAPVVLVTATPVCNGLDDLRGLLSYFMSDARTRGVVGMGLFEAFERAAAGCFDLTELLEAVVIRRSRADFGELRRPKVRFEVVRYEAEAQERWVWRHLEEELRAMTLAAFEGEWPRGLFVASGLRQWEGGAGALGEALERLAHYFERWLEAARQGRWLDAGAFREVFEGVSRAQEVMGFLYGDREAHVEALARAQEGVEADLWRVRGLLGRLEAMREEGGLANAVVGLVGEEAGERWLVFTGYQGGARALFEAISRRLGGGVGVGLMTGEMARATGVGRLDVAELVERFVGDVLARDRVGVLVATDCLAEGVNLQRCRRLVLADLPYSPLRLEQRVGRVVRPGPTGEEVRVFLPRPTVWADTLGMRRRLEAKIAQAQEVGLAPGLAAGVWRGLGEEGSAAMEGETTAPLARIGVLEAMTLEDRLRAQLLGEEGEVVFGKVGAGEVVRVLARVRVVAAVERYVWVSADGQQARVGRLSERLGGLVALSGEALEVGAWTPRAEPCWEKVRAWAVGRCEELEAARLAPAVVWRGSAGVRVWELLVEAARSGALGVTLQELGAYRQRVLGEHPAGMLRRWEGMLAMGADAGAFWQEVQALPEPFSEPVRVEVVAALGWSARAESAALRAAGLFEELPVGVGEVAEDQKDEDAALKGVEGDGAGDDQGADGDFCGGGQGLALGPGAAQKVKEGLAAVHREDGQEVKDEPEGVDDG
ncbi:DEAD/DEAH box helicase [Lujinxingia vulgaris]|uniref:DEAD/DEAH box helicase n=1 Tax=Lujinxingia vulgaris TaxID=2600176 RepID=A0A5C6WW23_9DELT|nr:DEAD/DEAH box helicase [Lujinxingia vulgaris]